MKKYFSLLCVLFVTFSIFAQNIDSTYRPGAFIPRSGLWENPKVNHQAVVFLGNSITHGFEWAEYLGDVKYKNRGISGDITFGVVERLHQVIQIQPAKVFLLIGINDISRNIPQEMIANNIRRIVQRIRTESPQTKVYVQSIFPTNEKFNKFPKHYNKQGIVDYVNEASKVTCKDLGAQYLDVASVLTDSNGKLKEEITYDGLHLLNAGYVLWIDYLKSLKVL